MLYCSATHVLAVGDLYLPKARMTMFWVAGQFSFLLNRVFSAMPPGTKEPPQCTYKGPGWVPWINIFQFSCPAEDWSGIQKICDTFVTVLLLSSLWNFVTNISFPKLSALEAYSLKYTFKYHFKWIFGKSTLKMYVQFILFNPISIYLLSQSLVVLIIIGKTLQVYL